MEKAPFQTKIMINSWWITNEYAHRDMMNVENGRCISLQTNEMAESKQFRQTAISINYSSLFWMQAIINTFHTVGQ